MALGESVLVETVDERHSSKSDNGSVKVEEVFDIVKATQYGIYDRCKELIDDGFDVNQRDAENITLLHWAAINARKDILKLYIDAGAIVDAVGGELQSTPLHWATRQGHLSMVVYLMKEGADPTLRDGEGCSAIHLAAQFGYTPIVAYLLAKGISPDIQDRNGMTPLMWACARIHTPDPVRLILTFGSNTSIQEKTHQNTALHWAIHSKNSTALTLLLKKNAPLDIANAEGDTPFSIIKKISTGKSDWIGRKALECVLEKTEIKKTGWLGDLNQNKKLKCWVTTLIPFILMYMVGEVLAADIGILFKITLCIVAFVVFRGIGRFICDDRFMSIFPINVYLATKFWMYVTWFIYLAPVLPASDTIIFVSMSTFLWYNFLKAWRGDPGVILVGKEERHQTIIDLAEEGGFDSKYFCTTCLVRKPMRSKHCSVCDRCVSKFDHHCPWLSNCVGWKNHKYFIGYLFGLVIMCLRYVLGVFAFWQQSCGIGNGGGNVVKIITCNPWVTFMALQAGIHGVWVFCLLICQLYQVCWLGATTNERVNHSRYNYFGSHSPTQVFGTPTNHRKEDCKISGRRKKHVFSRTPWQNTVDFFDLRWFRVYRRVDWSRAYAPVSSHSGEFNQTDVESLLKDTRDNYQYV